MSMFFMYLKNIDMINKLKKNMKILAQDYSVFQRFHSIVLSYRIIEFRYEIIYYFYSSSAAYSGRRKSAAGSSLVSSLV